jgi:N-methylhydantoinase A
MPLDSGSSSAALSEKVAEPLGLDLAAAAAGIVRIVNTNMSKAVRSILVERGFDPRDFVLMGFGGCGGLHAAAVIRELNIPHAVVPNNPGALSAVGMLGTDFRHDRSRTHVRPLAELDVGGVEKVFAELEREALAALTGEEVDEAAIELHRSVDLRYIGQEYHLNLPCPAAGEPLEPAALQRGFNESHNRVYGYATPDFPVQLVNLRVVGIGSTARPALPTVPPREAGSALEARATRDVYFDDEGWTPTAIYNVQDLRDGDLLPGPCIVEDPRSTMLVLPRQHGRIDRFRNLHIHEGA